MRVCSELGERVYAEKQEMMRGILGKCGGSKGKQKSRRARALRDENIDSLSVTIFYLQQKEYFLFEVLAWELFIKYVLKIWNI